MEKNIKLSLVIILVAITLGVGFIFGVMMRKCRPVISCPTCYLDSKMIGSWVGYATGELKEISGRDLRLVSGDETLNLSVLDGAKIQILEEGKPKEAKFEDIKIGDKLEIQFVFFSKKIFGSMVTILPK